MDYKKIIGTSSLAEQQRLAGVEVTEDNKVTEIDSKVVPHHKTKHGEINPPRITPKIRMALALKVGTTARNVEVVPKMRKPQTVYSNDYKKHWIRVGAKWLDRHGY